MRKVLIANRGEIAVRIIRACREMGIETVAVCSEADKDSLPVQLADSAVCIGPWPAKDSYLNMERILSAAVATGADGIHPGFGFLSENAKFAKLCRQCGITFIGPSPESMASMGNKAEARKKMEEAGVPVVPGTKEPVLDWEEGKAFGDKIGYPVIIKAVSGGGGKGMREVSRSEEFRSAFETAQKEAQNAFGDGSLYVERFVEHARHVEFQILGDEFGNVVHLGERDCSIQRRHQKLIEETPCVVLDEKLRKEMGEAAVKAAKAVNYNSAGTIEFLLEPSGRFYFMEMNTRIQVEHPVTEMVTGIDLIKEMIRIADGKPLDLRQEEICLAGHAIECRINAEDPQKSFLPSPGTITELHFPGGNGVRVDSALYTGYTIPACYDSMIAKIIVHGKDREDAIRKMRSALGEVVIGGIQTNVDFQYRLLGEDAFWKGQAEQLNEIVNRRL